MHMQYDISPWSNFHQERTSKVRLQKCQKGSRQKDEEMGILVTGPPRICMGYPGLYWMSLQCRCPEAEAIWNATVPSTVIDIFICNMT